MHAVVVTAKIDDYEPARKILHERVIPMVQQQPGFVSGTWLAPIDGRGLSVVVFETEENASGMRSQLESMPMEGPVTIESIQIREVAGRA
jgi:hypothetical protein